MITCRLFDGGTYGRVSREEVPGMDLLWYPQVDYEENITDLRDKTNTNAAMTEAFERLDLDPWPEQMPGCAWVDYSDRHETGSDGLQVVIHQVGAPSADAGAAPGGEAELDTATPEPDRYREQARFAEALTWREVQARKITEGHEQTWLRLDTLNEATAWCDLGAPLEAKFTGLAGATFKLELPDNALFAPFDLREWESRYVAVDQDGFPLEDQERWFELHDGGLYHLYLRPRRWRLVVWVMAHFIFVTPFELVLNDEVFLRAYYDRPAFYPVRHDVLTTSTTTPMWGYFGNPLSYDAGIEDSFDRSQTAQDLRLEILSQQYYSLCVSYIFQYNDPAEITVWKRSPLEDQLVLVIGQVDNLSGHEETVEIWQVASTDADYPQSVLGEFWAYFNAASI